MEYFALLPALGWGLMPVLASLTQSKPKEQLLGTTFVAFIFGFCFFCIKQPGINLSIFLVGLSSGCVWAIGQRLQFESIHRVPVAKVMPLSNGSQLIGTTLVSAFFFKEWSMKSGIILGTLGICLLIFGMVATTYQEKQMTENKQEIKFINLNNIFLIGLSSLALIIYVTIPKLFKVSAVDIIFPQAIGMFCFSILMAITEIKILDLKKIQKNLLTGLLWSLANLSFFLVVPILGVAKSFAISQLAVVVSISAGIRFLKIKKTKKEMSITIIGAVLIILGIFCISLIQK